MRVKVVFASLLMFSIASAETLFFEDFTDLSAWAGKFDGQHSAVIVDDPLRAGNSVVSFTSLTSRGDIFSSEIQVQAGKRYVLEFEYLGLPGKGVPSDLGGFIGLADNTNTTFVGGQQLWLDGTGEEPNVLTSTLVDDGKWREYSLNFDPFSTHQFDSLAPRGSEEPFRPINNTLRIMMEDFLDSRGVAGDIFFDEVRLTLACSPWQPGDATQDGTVDFADFLAVSASFGTPGNWENGDFDCDGEIVFKDFLILSDNFGKSIATATISVPEPEGVAFLACLLLYQCCWLRPVNATR